MVILLLAVWLVVLLMLLASTAEDFFVPPLERIARRLQLSPVWAGVTLLAFGNVAPDGRASDDEPSVDGDCTTCTCEGLSGWSLCKQRE